MTNQIRKPWSNRLLLWIASLSAFIGVAPILSNIASSQIASAFGCYMGEFQIYTRSQAADGYDPAGCHAGGLDVGPALVAAHTFIFAFFLTWPLLFLSIFVWAVLAARWLRREDRQS
jgi:hypothetical protein